MNEYSNTKNKPYIIYGLKDPRSFEPRYVGMTCQTIMSRRGSHLTPSQLKRKTLKINWIKSLLSINLEPEIFLIEEVDGHDLAETREIYWISKFKSLGYRLTNGTAGGDGAVGHVVSPEHREAIRKAQVGRKITNKTRKRMSKSMRGNTNGRFGKGIHRPEPSNKILDKQQELEIIEKYKSGKYSERTLAKEYNLHRNVIKRTIIRYKINIKNIKFSYVKNHFPKKLSIDQQIEIKQKYPQVKSIRKLAKEYGVDKKLISLVLQDKY